MLKVSLLNTKTDFLPNLLIYVHLIEIKQQQKTGRNH